MRLVAAQPDVDGACPSCGSTDQVEVDPAYLHCNRCNLVFHGGEGPQPARPRARPKLRVVRTGE